MEKTIKINKLTRNESNSTQPLKTTSGILFNITFVLGHVYCSSALLDFSQLSSTGLVAQIEMMCIYSI